MTLEALRKEIDAIDDRLIEDFIDRMAVVEEISAAKRQTGKAVLDPARERQKLADVAAKLPPELEQYGYALWSMLFELSRSRQSALRAEPSALRREIEHAMEWTDKLFPPKASVACQGVEGAYSQLACDKLFKHPQVMYFGSFDAVFTAVEQGFCRFGVLPLENSTAGSVNQVYDLMRRHNFKIVRSTRLKIDHNLVAKKGTALADVKEIFPHEQAISQCAEYIKKLGNVKVTVCENTAAAAKFVSESPRTDVAALSSRACAELYGLESLAESVQDKGNNYTRFICISKKLEIYPGADKTSVVILTDHKPGALYKLLARFYALGINLTKLESRPLPDRDFEFLFYFDLETSVYSPEFITLIGELESSCEQFRYLGSYSELV